MNKELDERYMELALEEARNAEMAGEVPIGAVVVAGDRIVGRGFNQPISAKDPTAHAEILAMRQAAAALGNYRLSGVTLYCTVEPCIMCAGAMIHARIERLVFGAADPKAGAAGALYNVLSDPRLNHNVHVTRGIGGDLSSSLLREFFARRR